MSEPYGKDNPYGGSKLDAEVFELTEKLLKLWKKNVVNPRMMINICETEMTRMSELIGEIDAAVFFTFNQPEDSFVGEYWAGQKKNYEMIVHQRQNMIEELKCSVGEAKSQILSELRRLGYGGVDDLE